MYSFLTVFKKLANPDFFCFLSFFSNTIFSRQIVDLSMIRTRTVGWEGKHPDLLTNTTTVTKLMKFFRKRSHPLVRLLSLSAKS